jgi:fructose-1,6-bisphosphatase-3
VRSEKLQRHVRFLYSAGSLYKCVNQNLLIHGGVPMDPDGGFTSLELDGRRLSGRALLDCCEKLARMGYFAPRHSEEKQRGMDFFWYLWCGGGSPLFGRDRMTTFERALIKDKTSWEEPENSFYIHTEHEEGCRRVLEEFGIPGDSGHIICGHIPCAARTEEPHQGQRGLIRIDGGFSAAYQRPPASPGTR